MRRNALIAAILAVVALLATGGCAESARPLEGKAFMVLHPGLFGPGAELEPWSGDEFDRRDGRLGAWSEPVMPWVSVARVRSVDRLRTSSSGRVNDTSYTRTRSVQIFR